MKAILLSFSALAMVVGAPASARDFVVVHDDLDLSTPKGQQSLERRIDAAARAYCGTERITTGTRIPPSGSAKCYKAARNAAREQMAVLVSRSQKGG